MDERDWQIASRLVGSVQPEPPDGGGGDAEAAREALEQRYAERLLEDEGLRDRLTDDEYQPIQDWALDQLHVRASALADAASPAAEEEMTHALECLRTILRAVNDTIGRRAELDAAAFVDGLLPARGALEPALYGAEGPAVEAQGALETVLPDLAARKDTAEGVELVEALVAALGQGSAPSARGLSVDGEHA
jgi:hypothetical protein